MDHDVYIDSLWQQPRNFDEISYPPFMSLEVLLQAFRFMVGPGHCLMISKYGPSLFKAVDPSFLVVKNLTLIKISSYSKSSNSTKQKVHVGCQYSKTCLKQPLKIDKTKILIKNGSLKRLSLQL